MRIIVQPQDREGEIWCIQFFTGFGLVHLPLCGCQLQQERRGVLDMDGFDPPSEKRCNITMEKMKKGRHTK